MRSIAKLIFNLTADHIGYTVEKEEDMIEKLEEYVNNKKFTTRMDCINFCIGWLENKGNTALPFVVIEHINKLYYDGRLKD